MNDALGNVGSTVVYTQTAEAQPIDQRAALRELVGEMNAGTVSLLLVLGGNPVYTAPSDLKFAEAMDKVPLRAHLGQYHDETAALLPLAHPGDALPRGVERRARPTTGPSTIVQPLIAPLYNGKSAHEVRRPTLERRRRRARCRATTIGPRSSLERRRRRPAAPTRRRPPPDRAPRPAAAPLRRRAGLPGTPPPLHRRSTRTGGAGCTTG